MLTVGWHTHDEYLNFFDVVPRILRDEELRPRLMRLYKWYRHPDSWTLAGTDDEEVRKGLLPLATLTVGMLDGLALQSKADPDFDIGPAVDLWMEMVQDYVGRPACRQA